MTSVYYLILSPHWGEQRDWSDLVFLLALMGEVLNFIFIY